MRSWLILILTFLNFSLTARADSSSHIDIIFDIDWTTFYSVEEAARDDKTVMVEGKLYRATDFLAETIEWILHRHPKARISFFSGGGKSRNELLLDTVRLSDGRSLRDISFRIFSKQDLLVASEDPQLKFAERYKKDVAGLLPNWDPRRTILIDDQVIFAKAPLRAVPSLGVFNFQTSFNESKKNDSFFPPTQEAWSMERNKALIWAALLEKAFVANENATASFSGTALQSWKLHSTDESVLPLGRALLRPFSSNACTKVFGH